jgi:hypothetical protein
VVFLYRELLILSAPAVEAMLLLCRMLPKREPFTLLAREPLMLLLRFDEGLRASEGSRVRRVPLAPLLLRAAGLSSVMGAEMNLCCAIVVRPPGECMLPPRVLRAPPPRTMLCEAGSPSAPSSSNVPRAWIAFWRSNSFISAAYAALSL